MRKAVGLWLLVGGCGTKQQASAPEGAPDAPLGLEWEPEPEQDGLTVRLSEGVRPFVVAGPSASGDAATSLSGAETAALVSRLPPIDAPPSDRSSFAKREDSRPPPQTGAVVASPFPPPPAPAPAPEAAGALTVLRFAPEGPVPLAPHLSVTFSQPMVAVTSQEAAAKTVPVRLDPEPPGAWRWLGTRTLLFEPDPRFPMATTYTATVDAGAVSAVGGALAAAASWTFVTPPPTVTESWPVSGPHPLDPLVFVVFDQKIDPAAMAPFVALRGNKGDVALVAASEAEIEAHKEVAARVKSAEVGRFGVWRPAAPLEPATTYTVVVRAGAPSAEGPGVTPKDQSTSFYTYPALGVRRQDCSWGRDGCAPGSPLWIEMNNPIDEAFDPSTITVEPALEGQRVQVAGTSVTVFGDTRPGTSYAVTLPASLRDRFGQTLGASEVRRFQVGHAEPTLRGPGVDMLVLDPAAPPVYPVYSVGHAAVRFRAWRVTPADYAAFSDWMRKVRYDGYVHGSPPGRLAIDRVVTVDTSERDALTETPIPLGPYLDGDKGQLVVWVEPTVQKKERWERIDLISWVQATDIGLTAFVDQDEVFAWATSLADGRPLAGVPVSLLGREGSVTTGPDGVASIGKYVDQDGPHALVAGSGPDVAMLPDQSGWWNEYGSWRRYEAGEVMRWYVVDDRKMYRPGETVSIKGWMRRHDLGPGGQTGAYAEPPQTVRWTLTDSRGVALGEGTAQVDASSGFAFTLALPATPNLGSAMLDLSTEGGSAYGWHRHTFEIQEFRRPEFEVTSSMDPGPYVLGGHAWVEAKAAYYAGGALPDAPVAWSVSWSPAGYVPPGHSDYRFGQWVPWWWGEGRGRSGVGGSASLAGVTDALGTHTLKMDFLALKPAVPMQVTASATVVDVNRQRWTSSQSLTLHPAAVYVGLKPTRGFYDRGDDVEVDVVVVDIDGAPAVGKDVTVSLGRVVWVHKDGTWKEEVEPFDTCDVRSKLEPVRCELDENAGGTWRVGAVVRDDEGRPSRTEFDVYVSGAGGLTPPTRDVAQEELVLVPDQEELAVGDTARIFVQSPFWPANGVMLIESQGVLGRAAFHLDGPSTTLDVPVVDAYVPDVTVQIEVVGSAPRTDDEGAPLPDKARRVAFASGSLTLRVPPVAHALDVVVTPRERSLAPGGSTVLDLAVRDAAGKPVPGASVAVMVVDEAVLALSAYQLPDPMEVFWAARGAGVQTVHARHLVRLANPDDAVDNGVLGGALGDTFGAGGLGARGSGMGGGGMAEGLAAPEEPAPAAPAAAAEPVMRARAMKEERKNEAAAAPSGVVADLRTDFSALALFSPDERTDSDGRLSVPVTLPDNLTRYRVMVVAATEGVAFGSAESAITARKPLMLRPSPPRFLNFGDRAELPLVVQNQTDVPMEVQVGLVANNAAVLSAIDGPVDLSVVTAGRAMTVPAQGRRELRVPIATDLAGTARFSAIVTSAAGEDAAAFQFPVWTPATSEAFATYGVLDKGAARQPVQAPPDVWPGYGGLEVTTSTTAVAALTDAVLYLQGYPYDCSEQLASRVMAVAALRDVLEAFDVAGMPSPEDQRAAVTRDLERLARRQASNGGWGYFGTMPDEPYLSVHVADAVARAEAAGFPPAPGVRSRALEYLRSIRQHIPGWYSKEAEWTIRAHALAVRHAWGQGDVAAARALVAEAGLERLPIEAQAWVLPVLQAGGATQEAASIVRFLENRVTETAAGAQIDVAYGDDADWVLLHSSRRTDGLVLDALIQVAPSHDVIPKLVSGLLGHRVAGKWGSTQENAYILLALHRYFVTFEGVTPDLVARVWLGDTYAGEHAYRGRTTEQARVDVPMGWLTESAGPQDLLVANDGVGRLYYRIGMTYAPRDLKLDPADYGFEVSRVYEAVDDPSDVRREPDGTWVVRAGARVRGRVTMVATARRTHVMLVDPLPAGLEVLNPALAVTGALPADPNKADNGWWWRGTWYQHQNVRDERVEAFTPLLWSGVWSYSWVGVATTPGSFVVPPAKAEEMYHPEVFGRSGTDRLVVR
jgi:uncharacterized protein YfaS (alpha-2-macroglobulin family)